MKFYVYMLFDEGGTVRYVGKGGQHRMQYHAQKRRMVGEKVKGGMCEADAFALERSLIASLGRIRDGGPLLNLTAGGQGVADCPVRSRAISRALRGRKFSKEWRQKLSEAAKSRDRSAGYSKEHSSAISKSLVAFWAKRRVDAQRSGRPLQRLGWEQKGG